MKQITKEEFKKLTREYVEADREFKAFIAQYIALSDFNGIDNQTVKPLTEEAADEIRNAEERFRDIENKWFAVARGEVKLFD